MAEGKDIVQNRGNKPAVPPKPKIISKPNPPPKPRHPPIVIKDRLRNEILSQNSHSTSKSEADSKFQPRIVFPQNGFDSRVPSIESQETDSTDGGSQSPMSVKHRIACFDSSRMVLTNGGWRNSSGNRSSASSVESSECSDFNHENNIDDNLEKLSDIDCTEVRSNCSSSSFQIKSDFCSSPVQENPSLQFRLSPQRDVTNSVPNSSTLCNHNNNNQLNDSKKLKIYNIVKEMMTSEEVFYNVLKLLNVEFRNYVKEQGCISTSNKTQASEDELNRILNYLPQLQNFSEGFLADLKTRLADWDQHYKIADIIVTKGPFLKMYSCYIRDFEHQCTLLDEACSKYPSFSKAVQSFEASEICRKLNLKHYMLKPVQRIPQYRLMFQSYLDLLTLSSPDLEDARRALTILEGVAAHANDTIKIEDKVSELLCLQRRLFRDQDGGQPELIKPGRVLLKQGELMKLSRRGTHPRYFVLLSDGLLYTSYSSSSSSGLLRLNTELPLEGMKVTKPTADDFRAEFTIRATQRSFTLQAKDESERDEWMSAVQGAIDANIVRRRTFQLATTAAYVPPQEYQLGKQAPVWVPDYRVTMCQMCTSEFSLTFRRHHCRACGKVVCDLCSSNRAPLEYKKNQSERVCDACFESLFRIMQEKIQQKEQDEEEKKDKPEERESDEDEKYTKENIISLSDLMRLKQNFKKGIRDSMRGKSVKKPERLLEVSANDSGSQMRGYLRKMGRRGWFVLKERVLYQYAAPEDVCALESLPVLGYTIQARGLDNDREEPSFILQHPNQDDIVFVAETTDLVNKWVVAMKEATVL